MDELGNPDPAAAKSAPPSSPNPAIRCPRCLSSRIDTRNRAREAGSTIGSVAGATGGMAAALAGAETGAVVGSIARSDRHRTQRRSPARSSPGCGAECISFKWNVRVSRRRATQSRRITNASRNSPTQEHPPVLRECGFPDRIAIDQSENPITHEKQTARMLRLSSNLAGTIAYCVATTCIPGAGTDSR
ncbi:hypothetical protein [Burkholderia sp. NLJ2]|uniref:hypothetical protein n=1 Tax=Burkholderia sp. NLJ2 TaxID=3090699 RepID=UPI003C6C0272